MEELNKEHKQMMIELFEQVWGKGDIEAADKFYAPGDTLQGIKQFGRKLYASFPDWQVTINDMVAEGDKIVVYWTGRGTHQGEWQGVAPTGRYISVSGMDIEYLSGGRIVNEEGIVDMMEMMGQLTGENPA